MTVEQSLTSISTCCLVEELKSREGVKGLAAGPLRQGPTKKKKSLSKVPP